MDILHHWLNEHKDVQGFTKNIKQCNELTVYKLEIRKSLPNKRAQRALGRSPEEKVKGHSVANNREPQGHNLINFGRGPFDDVIYLI